MFPFTRSLSFAIRGFSVAMILTTCRGIGAGVLPPEVPTASGRPQTGTGQKRPAQQALGELDWCEARDGQFSGELQGDVVGRPWETRIVNVPAAALPAIGFVPGARTQVKYVHADADPADPARDGSLAHPFADLAAAAASARDGDRFIVQGTFSRAAVFTASVSLEGAGPETAVLFESLEFAGAGPSRLSGIRVGCTSDGPCVNNRTIGNRPLYLENVEIAQSLSGPALASAGGAVIAIHSSFMSFGAGAAVDLTLAAREESRFVDCESVNAAAGPALSVRGGRVAIVNGRISAAGKGPAASFTGVPALSLRGAALDSAGMVLSLRNTPVALAFENILTPGIGVAAVTIDNDPVLTFAAVRGPGLVFVDNVFSSNIQGVFRCAQRSLLLTRGNLIPMHSGMGGVTGLVDGCQRLSFTGF